MGFSLTPGEGDFDIGVTYFHERRTGTRTNNGTAFGFNNVIETPDPVRYITQDFGLNATSRQDWGVVFAAFHYNDFSDQYGHLRLGQPLSSDGLDERQRLPRPILYDCGPGDRSVSPFRRATKPGT